ncbi:MAG: hypothetical protein FJ388_20950, partial [Verrucomicrobia bacterium]|nr:hypothetical protein [Verrucomicrobiota bacterium]
MKPQSKSIGIGTKRLSELRADFKKVERVLAATPPINKQFAIPTDEFVARQRKVSAALKEAGFEV